MLAYLGVSIVVVRVMRLVWVLLEIWALIEYWYALGVGSIGSGGVKISVRKQKHEYIVSVGGLWCVS